MSEANNNATSFSSESNLTPAEHDNLPQAENCETASLESQDSNQTKQKMNWQKVAHKLREYNRKLLKEVFSLKQELADIDNKFEKYVEKSQNSDLLVAQQESKIQEYQKQISLLTERLTTSQQKLGQKETTIEELSQQYKQSQQQTALLERDCTLLQESHSQKSYDLIAKEQEIKELQTKLNQQQRYALQYKAELKRYQDKPTIPIKEPVVSANHKNYSPTRSIQPWSNSTSEPKIALPKTKTYSVSHNRSTTKYKSSGTIKTAAEIATWSASQIQQKQKAKTADRNQTKSSSSKPQSLAAVDLPTFPRPR